MTIFELREKMATLQAAINADAQFIAEKAADPSVAMEEITAKQTHMEDLQKRFNMLKGQAEAEEARQREALENQQKQLSGAPANDKTAAKAAFFRDAFAGVRGKSYEGLGGIPAADADLGNGSALLPKNISNELIVEPVEINPLREIARVTNITGLEEPKLGFTIEDADLGDVTDKQTANEIAMDGATVSYGRYKAKVSATVKDTVYHGTDVDLVSAIENNLRAALAMREKKFAFLSAEACGTDTTHAHMSFYNESSGTPVITHKTGATMYDAIVAAYADLPEEFAARASILMKKADYFAMIKELANSSDVLFSDKAKAILGIPVVFCEKATMPIVGDFSYYGINYDIDAVYETDKDAKKGEYYFVLTAWGDQQIRLKSAFRIAEVDENP